eukprot:2462501-Pleurochrysis_carterae.AAC.3
MTAGRLCPTHAAHPANLHFASGIGRNFHQSSALGRLLCQGMVSSTNADDCLSRLRATSPLSLMAAAAASACAVLGLSGQAVSEPAPPSTVPLPADVPRKAAPKLADVPLPSAAALGRESRHFAVYTSTGERVSLAEVVRAAVEVCSALAAL